MDRLVSGLLIVMCLLFVVGVGSGVGATLPADSTTGSGSASAFGMDVDPDNNESANASDVANVTDVDPTFENVTVPISDAEPFEFGTTVVVQEETLMSMTFRADESDIEGNVSVRENQSPTLETLSEDRTLHNAIDVTVPDSATDVSTTLRLVVAAQPVDDRENLEVMRHTDREWEPLETEVVSNRIWSSDRGASVMLLEAETSGFSTFAVTETTETETDEDAEAEEVGQEELETDNKTAFVPPLEADVYRISDRRPFEFGTHVHIHEETVRAITFQDDVEGYVAINASNSSAVSELRDERPVIRALNITATENASQTPATLHLSVRATALENRDDVEMMRYNADDESWEPLETEVVSDRYWSTDHDASVFDVEAETPGFSTFAVTEASDAVAEDSDENSDNETDDGPESEPEELPEEDSDDSDGLLFGFGFLEIVIVLVVLAGGAGAIAVVRRR